MQNLRAASNVLSTILNMEDVLTGINLRLHTVWCVVGFFDGEIRCIWL